MKTYSIVAEEILSRTVDIEADSEDQALIIAEQMYNDEDIVLDYRDHHFTSFY